MKTYIPGIKWKLFGYLIGFTLLLLVILALFQTVFLERFYIMIKQNQVEAEISAISKYVRNADWEGLADAAGEPGDLFVEIWNPNKGLVTSSGTFQNNVHTQLRPDDRDDLYELLLTNDGSITQQYHIRDKSGKSGRESMISAQLIESTDGSVYMTLVSAGLSPVNATVDTLKIQLISISALMLILTTGLALLISRKISKPLVAISRTAAELGKGNYQVVFEGSGYQEVVQLADILTETAKELSNTETLRQELIANVSHDLRTPLTLIAGYGEMIRDMPDEATPENMQVIIDETNRLSSLVNDLLDLSRLQSGTVKLSVEPFDLDTLTREITGRVSRFCEQDGYTIICKSAGATLVTGDRERIAQVIYNFLLNAVTHTGAERRITVILSQEDGRARLEVHDTGPGIAANDLPHIWDRYYKVDKSHRRPAAGSGLGLSIVRSILEHHPDVTYGVESERQKGTVFWFSLPYNNVQQFFSYPSPVHQIEDV